MTLGMGRLFRLISKWPPCHCKGLCKGLREAERPERRFNDGSRGLNDMAPGAKGCGWPSRAGKGNKQSGFSLPASGRTQFC